MVTDTRSARKSKDESDGHTSKKKVDTRKDSSVRSPGNADKTSTSRQMTPSPQSTRKSMRLDKEMPPLTPPGNRKSERLGKYNTPSPLRRSDRGKKDLSSGSSGSKQSAKKPSPSESKRKKEKTLIQVTMESKKAELDQEAVGMKRKNMNARMFKAQFKRQRMLEIAPDGGKELERSEKIFDDCSDNSRDNGSKQMGVVGKLSDEGVGRACNGALEESISTLKGYPAEVENAIHVDSSCRDYVVDEPCSKFSHTSSSVRNMFDNPERLPMNCSTTENMDASESDGSVSSDISERCMYPKVAEATTSPASKCENCNFLGTCVLCSKNKRVSYDSPEQELCSCSPTVCKDLGCFTTCKDRSDLGAAVTSDSQRDGRQNVCALCDKDGELLCCVGKGCKICYHLCCLDPSLTDAPRGVWHCPQCVKKKLLFGVHSVSEGVESIWEVREVEVSNAKGARQRQYLVKYHGLAHIHNHWVPEKQLLLENPCLVSNFVKKDKIVRLSAEWMVPHRLLRKRSIEDKIFIASSAVISVCEYEWLVKWRGLDYNHATWELDNSNFLSSSLGQNLMKDYEVRRQKANQEIDKPYTGSAVKLPELPASRSHVNENYVLKNVNKLREFSFKCLNAVVFDDQERAMTVIFFIQSMSEICRPFLFVTTSSSLSQWEAEFAQLVPSLDVVVYSGSAATRKGIRASEFYDEEGRMMVQVLLSSIEAVSEDLEILRSIKWKAIVIDEYQHSGISNALEQIKTFSTDLRILLVSGQIKDTTSEYLKILSLLEPHCDFDKLRGLKPETNDNLCKLKDRLSRFIAYGRTSQVSKFIEYWIPVQISNYQLEQYCAALLSNSIPLCSCSRSDPVGVLRDILLTVRKCCNHPYLLDSSVQERLIAEQRPAAEILDIGIKASGKLQLLDVMLTEIKTRGLQVLILFQLIIGSGGTSTGDILDDFLRQRCGQNTYERVDAGITPSKKQAAVNRFNKKETGQFVFLLENRACSSIIKLSSVDVVIIYDSDWNPANDLRALQKISVDSKVEQIKVFRLYSSFTIEERALVLAKQNLNLDNNLQKSRTTSDTLLSWGATYLFSKLDEYHADSEFNSDLNFSSEQLLLDEVTKEFQAILSENYENTHSNSIISEVKLGVGSYITNIPVLGEGKVKLKDGEEPHVFWRNLFDGKKPKWKHLKGPSPRNRKRVHYWEGSPSKSEIGKDDIVKKRKKMVNENLDPTLVQVESGAHQVTPVAVSKGGLSQDKLTSPPRPSTIKACNQSEIFQRDGQSSLGAEVSAGATSDRRIVSSGEQKGLHSVLQGEITILCQTLKLTEDVTHVVRKFLEYVIKNHHVNSDSPSIVQAFQISLCWVASSIKKQKVDKKDTFMLAKQLLNYQCTEEQANSVYSKMRSLKRMFLQSADNFTDSDRDCLLAEEGINREPSERKKLMIRESSAAASDVSNKIKKIQRKCDKRMKKLVRKHQQGIQEFQKFWKDKMEELEKDHKLESAVIRSIHGECSVGLDKLKLLEDNFAKKMEEHNLLKDVQLKKLEAEQLAAIDEERLKAADWQAKAKACSSEQRAVNGQHLVNSQSDDDTERPQPSTRVNIIGSGEVFPVSGQHVENKNHSMRSCTRGNDASPSTSSISAPAEAIVCEAPVGNFVTTNSQNEAGVISPAIVELLNQSKSSSDSEETVSANVSAPVEQASDDIQSVGRSEQHQVPNEMVGHVHSGELSNASNRESDKATKIASSDDLVSQRGGTEAASGGLHSTGQPLLLSEQTVASPDCCDLLPQQVRQDKTSRTLGSAQLQDSDAPAVENQSTLQIEIAASELMNSVTPVPSDLELPITEEIVTPVPSSCEDPINESSGQLHYSIVGVSSSCNQAPATENHDQGRSSSQTAEPGGAEVLSHESTSQRDENLEMHPNHLDTGPPIDAAHGQSVESSAVLQNDVAIPQVVVSTTERSNQAVPQVDIDAGNLHRPIYLVRPTHQPTSRNTPPSLLADPLQNELERMRKDTEQLEKTHEDMMSQLKSDCEKEIEEIVSQIRKKYEVKLQETEAEFRLKRNEHDKNQNKVLLNKVLAEAFRSKCLDLRPSGLPGPQQGVPSNLKQQLHQLPLPPSIRRSPGPSGCQSARTQLITTPAVQTMQQLSRPHSSRSPPVAIQSVAPPSITAQPVQGIQHAAAHLSDTSSRPPVISVITPAGNPRGGGGEIRSPAPHLQPFGGGGGEIRSPAPHLQPFGGGGGEIRSAARPAPHLQPFRPPTAASIVPTTSPSVSQLRPVQMLPSQPVQLPPQYGPLPRAPPQQPSPNLVTRERAELQGGIPAPPNPSPTTQGLVVGMDHRPSVPEQRASSLPDISSIFSSLELSDLEMLASVQGNQASAVATDVVCLSDDE